MPRKPGAASSGVVTMLDVARAAGVSAQTVSRVIGKADKVAVETKLKVHQAIAALGYIPNEAARNLASNSSRTVAVIIPTLASSAYAAQVSGIGEELEKRGISLIIGNSEYSLAREESLVRSLLERRPLGFIVTGLEHTATTTELLRSAGIPIVETWDTDKPAIDMAVGFSNFAAGQDVGKLLASSGAKRVAFVGGAADQDPRATSRFNGLVAGLEAGGVVSPIRVELNLPLSAADGVVGLEEVLRREPLTDAILFSVDSIALAALLECNRRGIRVPGQLSICGFGDYDLSSFVTPSLTSVRIQPSEMGRQAALLLLERFDGETNRGKSVALLHRLVRRGSA